MPPPFLRRMTNERDKSPTLQDEIICYLEICVKVFCIINTEIKFPILLGRFTKRPERYGLLSVKMILENRVYMF